ncbi:MAG: hypothetical protein BWY66_00558 [bacterium ADurb.Bin374]|nr:MAG: hypothetical protein BWY66_00558 [bacterium ADurb.Bin374]
MKKKSVPDIPSSPPVPPGVPTGWICPKCGASVSPRLGTCPDCSVSNVKIANPMRTDLPPYTIEPQIFCGVKQGE